MQEGLLSSLVWSWLNMFKEVVEISDIEGLRIKVKFNKRAMCDCCRYTSLCKTGDEEIFIENENGLAVNKGDKIEVGIEEKRTFLSALIIFLFPIIVFMAGLLVFASRGELSSFFIAVFAVLVYYVAVKLVLRRKGNYFNLRVLRIV